jgi:hypothetical protein
MEDIGVNDLELLRAYEPVICYTQGELFFPCAVDGYVARCGLLVRAGGGTPVAGVIVPEGELTLDRLAVEADADPARALCLRFVPEPLGGAALRQWQRRDDRPHFHAAGRLTRVGLWPRVLDSLFTLSLLLRGTVPGGTAAAAEIRYRALRAEAPAFVYYGRVRRERGYIILQYLFFYAMNDWRSSFAGVNDHEADWEQVFVYLTEQPDGPPQPAWVAYASHDYFGDDLRRRWDDPELHRQDDHPIVYAGAGSHASYFTPGEYLTSVRVRQLDPVLRVVQVIRRLWRDVLRQGEPAEFVRQIEGLVSIPFVDYARGDGRAIGPGRSDEWTPVLLTEGTAWAESYRGLWGLDTRDPLSGEIAPSGPKHQRDGSVRQSWDDPLGWAGLEKVAPAPREPDVLTERIAELERLRAETEDRLAAMETDLGRAALEVRSLHAVRYLDRLHRARERELAQQEAERNALRRRRVDLDETIAACRRQLARIEAGDAGDPRAHLHHTHEPEPPQEIRRGRLAEVWASLSIGVLLLGGVLIMLVDVDNWITALALFVTAVIVVENILHRSLTHLLLNVTVTLALLCTAVLVYEFFWYIGLAAVAAIALVILRDNLRELRRL